MQDIREYIKLSKEERQKHLKLQDNCVEIGGYSTQFKALLAHYLKTTLPSNGTKDKILLCHACNNEKCSNPNHLYWGTYQENFFDAKNNGFVLKGPKKGHYKHSEEVKERIRNANKGKIISKETRDKIRKSLKGKPHPRKPNKYKMAWITNGKENKKIKKEDLYIWLEKGYSKGRI